MNRSSIISTLFSFILLFSSGFASATVLTFNATYNSKLDFIGVTSPTVDENFKPTNFQFQISFDSTVKSLHPQTGSYIYPNGDGTSSNYNYSLTNTLFGNPTFSTSPFSSQLGNSIANPSTPFVYDYSQTSFNQGYNSSPNNGYKTLGISSHFEQQTSNDYNVYWMEVGINFIDAPSSINDVTFSNTSDLMSHLVQARDNGTSWSMDELGLFHQGSANRIGTEYFGSTSLIAIDGITTPVPEPQTYMMLIVGLLMFAARRARSEA